MFLLRQPILAVSRSTTARRVMTTAPMTKSVVRRFVAGEHADDAVRVVRALRADGLTATVDHLGEDVTALAQAEANTAAYVELLDALDRADLAVGTEVSVKLSALGSGLTDAPGGGETFARQAAGSVVRAAEQLGARVTIDMEDHRTVDATLRTVTALREQWPDVGVAIQAMLRRTPADVAALAGDGSRVRLVKGAYGEPGSVAFTNRDDIDRAYVRCLAALMQSDGYPMVATHDPRLITIAGTLAARSRRGPDDFEHQMLYGIRPDEQRTLRAAGRRVRVYVPYGSDWYGYFTRRLAEKPANLALFIRAVAARR